MREKGEDLAAEGCANGVVLALGRPPRGPSAQNAPVWHGSCANGACLAGRRSDLPGRRVARRLSCSVSRVFGMLRPSRIRYVSSAAHSACSVCRAYGAVLACVVHIGGKRQREPRHDPRRSTRSNPRAPEKTRGKGSCRRTRTPPLPAALTSSGFALLRWAGWGQGDFVDKNRGEVYICIDYWDSR